LFSGCVKALQNQKSYEARSFTSSSLNSLKFLLFPYRDYIIGPEMSEEA